MNRPISRAELFEMYNANPFHIWCKAEPPYLYIESKNALFVGLMSWGKIVNAIEKGAVFTGLDIAEYGQKWRLWYLKPKIEERDNARWEE